MFWPLTGKDFFLFLYSVISLNTFVCFYIKKTGKSSHHKFDGVDETLVKLSVLKSVLWVVNAVDHPTGAAGHSSKLLLTCILKINKK